MSRACSGRLRAVGIDLVAIGDVARLLRHPPSRLSRVFTRGELRLAPTGQPAREEICAYLFAGKEAVFKALGRGWGQGLRWSEIRLSRRSGAERWTVRLSGNAAARFRALGGRGLEVRTCRVGDHALAHAWLHA